LIRPTPRGLGTILGGCALLLIGLLLGYRELVAMGVAGLGALALGAAWGLAAPHVMVDRVVEPHRVRRGEPAASMVDVLLTSRARRVLRVCDLVTAEDGGPPVDPLAPAEMIVRPAIPTRVRLDLPTGQRGVFQVGPLRVGREDPLGLWSVLRPVGGSEQLTVWPAWHALTRSPIGRTAQIEAARDRLDADSITFDTLREYVPGDDLRHIHWRTTARMGTLMVRKHDGASVARLVLLLDDRVGSYGDPAEFEEAVEVAASTLVSTVDEGLRLVLLFAADPSHEQPIPSAAAGLDRLAGVRLTSSGVSDQRIQAQLRSRPSGDSLLVVTGTRGGPALADGVASEYRSVLTAVLGPEPLAETTPRAVVSAPTAVRLVAILREQA
jgi:uncharacterized protein (DUF58 family)